jgi:hypothetical protein
MGEVSTIGLDLAKNVFVRLAGRTNTFFARSMPIISSVCMDDPLGYGCGCVNLGSY